MKEKPILTVNICFNLRCIDGQKECSLYVNKEKFLTTKYQNDYFNSFEDTKNNNSEIDLQQIKLAF